MRHFQYFPHFIRHENWNWISSRNYFQSRKKLLTRKVRRKLKNPLKTRKLKKFVNFIPSAYSIKCICINYDATVNEWKIVISDVDFALTYIIKFLTDSVRVVRRGWNKNYFFHCFCYYTKESEGNRTDELPSRWWINDEWKQLKT